MGFFCLRLYDLRLTTEDTLCSMLSGLCFLCGLKAGLAYEALAQWARPVLKPQGPERRSLSSPEA